MFEAEFLHGKRDVPRTDLAHFEPAENVPGRTW